MSSVRQMTGAAIAVSMAFYLVGAIPCAAAQLFGRVVVGGSPAADSTVTLWQAGMGAPQKVAETHSGRDGAFVFSNLQANENTIRYIVASVSTGPTTAAILRSFC